MLFTGMRTVGGKAEFLSRFQMRKKQRRLTDLPHILKSKRAVCSPSGRDVLYSRGCNPRCNAWANDSVFICSSIKKNDVGDRVTNCVPQFLTLYYVKAIFYLHRVTLLFLALTKGFDLIKAIFFDAFGKLCEIREKRNPYKPILKTWPSGVADAYQALMTRDSSLPDSPRKPDVPPGYTENGRRHYGGSRFDVSLPESFRLTGKRQARWPEMGHRFQFGYTLRRTAFEAAPLRPRRLRVVFHRGLPEAGRRDLSPCLQSAQRRTIFCPDGG